MPTLTIAPVDDLAALVRQALEHLEADADRLAELLLRFCPDRLIEAPELADLLAVSPATLDRLLATGAVPAPVRLGGSRRWVLSDLRNWLRAGCPSAAEWATRRKAARTS